VKAVEKMSKPLPPDQEENPGYVGKETVFAYWKKFKNQKWPSFDALLRSFPSYVERCDLLKPLSRALNLTVGIEVVPGPDCQKPFKKGTITEIEGNKVKVQIGTETEEFTQNSSNGVFELKAYGVEDQHLEVSVKTGKKEEYKDGVMLLPGAYREESPDYGEFGTIIRTFRDGVFAVKWETGTEERLSLPDADYALLAVSYKSPDAVTNFVKAKENTPLKKLKLEIW
jgi:hypothetical protein